MQNLKTSFEKTFEKLGLPTKLAEIVLSDRPDLSDYQCNGALPSAKVLKQSPLNIAKLIVDNLDPSLNDEYEFTVLNGFINIKLKDKCLIESAQNQNIEQENKKVIIDYGSPNVAKGMHVGHLRSTLIGASLVEIHKAKGHTVIGDNHLGDWGTPMGIVMQKISDTSNFIWNLANIEALYIDGSKQYKADEDFKYKVTKLTQALQSGDIEVKSLWSKLVETTINALKEDYSKMGISFDTWNGESFYESIMPSMIKDLKDQGFCQVSEGALVIELEGMSPLMLEKSGGGYLYHTSDLACVKYKSEQCDEMLYVVDKRQKLHFEQVFNASLKVGYINSLEQVKHIAFGTINGDDGKPFKTRDGGVLKLKDLIDQVTSAAQAKLNPSLTSDEAASALPIIAMGALKFSELKHQRMSDYSFNLEQFMSLEGFNGPAILYAGVRAKSILSKTTETGEFSDHINSDAQKKLLFVISKFTHAFNSALNNNEPHHLCEYSYELATAFNSFYNTTYILKETDLKLKKHYLACTELYLQTLIKTLKLLGIQLPEKM